MRTGAADRAEVAVVGAGPAGLAAAATLADHGADVLVIDEQPRGGGQIYRQPPASFAVDAPPAGDAHGAGHALLAAVASRPSIRWETETAVWGIFGVGAAADERAMEASGALAGTGVAGAARLPGVAVALSGPRGVRRVHARRVLLAPGAYDLPVPVPGWTLPGVMAAGGVQAFLKSQRLLPGWRFVLAGAHPLLLTIADQLLSAGAEIAAIVLAPRRPRLAANVRLLPRLRGHRAALAQAWGAWRRLRRAGVPVTWGEIIVGADGDGEVEGARVGSVDASWQRMGGERRIACDTIALGYGFVASSELARQAGCAVRFHAGSGGFVAEHDPWMRTSEEALYVAGEIAGVAGAEVAASEGRLAALGILHDLGRLAPRDAERAAAPVRRALARQRRLAGVLHEVFAPRHEALAALVTDDTVVCRCEEITGGVVRAALRDHPHLATSDAVKLLTRVGMGLCQGRLCGPSVMHLIAAARGRDVTRVGPYTARPPVKPLLAADLARAHNAGAAADPS